MSFLTEQELIHCLGQLREAVLAIYDSHPNMLQEVEQLRLQPWASIASATKEPK